MASFESGDMLPHSQIFASIHVETSEFRDRRKGGAAVESECGSIGNQNRNAGMKMVTERVHFLCDDTRYMAAPSNPQEAWIAKPSEALTAAIAGGTCARFPSSS